MQASDTWRPPGGTLGRILEATERRLPSLDEIAGSGLPPGAEGLAVTYLPGQEGPSLKRALTRETIAVIAELKRRSPSKGSLNEALDPSKQPPAFERGGAAAISVLTEPEFFGGSLNDLRSVRHSVSLPILRKDFHIHGIQLLEARMAGASAVLLIARALSPETLQSLMQSAKALQLEAVVEVRTDDELQAALDAGADVIGVNSRDLETLEVDPGIPERLVPRIPANVTAIWESGVQTVADVERAAACGADAVLVGSALSRSSDPESLVRSLAHVSRQRRRG